MQTALQKTNHNEYNNSVLQRKTTGAGFERSSARTMQEMIDNSPKVLQRKAIQQAIDNSPYQRAKANLAPSVYPIQRKENTTGMPDNLKTGLENISGFDMSGIRVHRNSGKPKEVGAAAYTKGTNIYLAPRQDSLLPHEAGHVVQQMQDRVQPTGKVSGQALNDSPGLEKEANTIGQSAMRFHGEASNTAGVIQQYLGIEDDGVVQRCRLCKRCETKLSIENGVYVCKNEKCSAYNLRLKPKKKWRELYDDSQDEDLFYELVRSEEQEEQQAEKEEYKMENLEKVEKNESDIDFLPRIKPLADTDKESVMTGVSKGMENEKKKGAHRERLEKVLEIADYVQTTGFTAAGLITITDKAGNTLLSTMSNVGTPLGGVGAGSGLVFGTASVIKGAKSVVGAKKHVRKMKQMVNKLNTSNQDGLLEIAGYYINQKRRKKRGVAANISMGAGSIAVGAVGLAAISVPTLGIPVLVGGVGLAILTVSILIYRGVRKKKKKKEFQKMLKSGRITKPVEQEYVKTLKTYHAYRIAKAYIDRIEGIDEMLNIMGIKEKTKARQKLDTAKKEGNLKSMTKIVEKKLGGF